MVIMMTKGTLVRARNTYDGKPAINVGVIIEKEAISMPPAIIVHDKTWLQSQTDTNLHVPTVLPTVSFPFWRSHCESPFCSPRKCSAALLLPEMDKTFRQICTGYVACSWGIWGMRENHCSLKAS
jgi:hypothetical protein